MEVNAYNVEKLIELERSKHVLTQVILDIEHEVNESLDRKGLLQAKLDEIILNQSILVPKGELLKTTLGSFSWKKTKVCTILDESTIPAEYFKDVPASTKLEKAKVKAAIESGEVIPGAEITENFNFQIKLKK